MRIDLDWTDNSDNEDGFEVERAEGAGGAFSQIDVLGAGVTTYVDSALASETEYCYRVRAYNTVGDSDYTAEVCATTLAEPDPGECTDAGNHDDLTDTWGIDQTNADLNATWQAAQTAGCEIDPWFFGIDTGVDSDHSDLNVVEIQGFLAADPRPRRRRRSRTRHAYCRFRGRDRRQRRCCQAWRRVLRYTASKSATHLANARLTTSLRRLTK